MIVKVVNGFDIHIYGQVLRIIEFDEMKVSPDGFDLNQLLLNEPRGNKYMNLLTFKETPSLIHVTLASVTGVENEDILLKVCLRALLDRHRIKTESEYSIKINGSVKTFKHQELNTTALFEVKHNGTDYTINHKRIKTVETDLQLEIHNISAIKEEINKQTDSNYDYLVLEHDTQHIAANRNGDILAHPVLEVLSLLNHKFEWHEISIFNGADISIQDGRLGHPYHLISNSQFYVDDTDIYQQGFVIK
ncbi:hypothetical protein [Salinicoccus albus]|uniref:hypothetical protein n=1 Tax=Salinicoccus albus TaxID=418756 RepID=UPI000360CDBB|nr:hypothetical protein [Salinicoccus albus]